MEGMSVTNDAGTLLLLQTEVPPGGSVTGESIVSSARLIPITGGYNQNGMLPAFVSNVNPSQDCPAPLSPGPKLPSAAAKGLKL